ncbi:MAG: COG4280 domain-containing protein [Vulcanimicrobiaceae bacterium]
MNLWILAGTCAVASTVEFVEAATIVLAVGFTQGWRAALGGALWASVALGVLVALFGPLLANIASVHRIEVFVGPFLIVYGIGWLRKAVWRYSGRKALRDEQANYDREITRLRADREHHLGFATAFQGVFTEGLEVAVIVVTFAASRPNSIAWAAGGAAVAFAAVLMAAIALHKPFSRVPENALKATVGVMLLSLGTLWAGEGLGLTWWLGDSTLFALIALYLVISVALVAATRPQAVKA